jgi:hypothetical protein
LQYYALGVPAAGVLDVYIAIDAAPERLPYLAVNSANRDADWLADRVVEAVLLESLIQWQRKSGLVRANGTPPCWFFSVAALLADRCWACRKVINCGVTGICSLATLGLLPNQSP